MNTMIKQFSLIFSLTIISLIIGSCKKSGCLVPYADNFNPDAKLDNNQCEYTGSRVFWMSKYTSDSLTILNDTTALYFYLDGVPLSDTLSTLNYVTGNPTCDDAKAVTLKAALGTKEEDFRNVQVFNAYNQLIYEQDVRFSSSVCNNTEIKPFQ